jgi:hypothetical protein
MLTEAFHSNLPLQQDSDLCHPLTHKTTRKTTTSSSSFGDTEISKIPQGIWHSF